VTVSRIPPIRPPGQWPEAQHALVTRAGTEPLPETPVHAEWWTNPTTWVPEYGTALLVVQGVRALVRRHRVGPEGAWIAVRRVHGALGPTELIVKVEPDVLPSPSGAGPAAVLLTGWVTSASARS
jgi:hypothetical protein